MDIITLDPTEMQIAKWLAERRFLSSRAAGQNGYENLTDKTAKELEELGVMGELAFCKYANLYFQLRQSGDNAGKPDATINGLTIDVKTAGFDTACLLLKAKEYRHAVFDYYVLMIRTGINTFEYAGYTTGVDLVRASNLRIFENGGPPAYSMSQGRLFKGLPTTHIEPVL